MQQCYKMFTSATYQIMMICHFCCIWCVHHMSMSSTWVLNYIMPSLQGLLSCIFVVYVVTSTSMQSSLRDVADFCDLVISAKSESVIFCCYVNLLSQWVLCIIWRYSLRMFCYTCYALSIHAHVWIYGVLYHVLILLYFCYKMFLTDCLHANQYCHGCW